MKKAIFTKPLTIAFSPEVYAQIKEITDRDNTSMAEYVREVIERGLTIRDEKATKEDANTFTGIGSD